MSSTERSRRDFLQQLAGLALLPPVLPFTYAQRRGGTAQASSKAFQSLESDVPALLEKFGVPGLSYAVIEDGAIARARGFGVKKAGGAAQR